MAPPVAYLPEGWLCSASFFFFFCYFWGLEMRHAHPPAEWICAVTRWISGWPPQWPRKGSGEMKRREKAALDFPPCQNVTPDGMSRRYFWNKQVKAAGDRIKPITQNSARRGLVANTCCLFYIYIIYIYFLNVQTTANFPSQSCAVSSSVRPVFTVFHR